MKKNQKWFFVSFSLIAIPSILTAGCASTPKVVQTVPTYIGTNAPPTNASPYRFSQEPAKRVIEDDGREYRNHILELQRHRLAHERQLARIEQAAEEAALANERGVNLQPPAQPQPQAAAPVQQQSAQFGQLPNGAPVLLPSQSLIPVVPQQQYYPYEERPFYGTLPNGAPVLLPSGGGGFGGGFGGCSSGFGSVPITQGTYRSSVRADWGPVQNGGLGKAFRWLTKSEDFPGYHQTGGPATIVRTYNAGGQVVAGGGFTSGLAFGWRR